MVTTLAGSGTAGFADGTGAAAQFNQPHDVAVDSAGTVYVADLANSRIRKVTSAGVVTTLAGSGTAGFADGTGAAAQFNGPRGVAVDAAGTVYIGDLSNNRIRKVTSAGVVTTLAGSGTAGFADGTGAAAQFNQPYGVAVDSAGTFYIGDLSNNRIRKITADGAVAAVTTTIIRTVGGVAETVISQYPLSPGSLTILDMLPTINGDNLYTITTFSSLGATAVTTVTLTTTEGEWAFLNAGTGYATIVNFQGDLQFQSAPSRSTALMQAAGRTRPIALFGPSGMLEVSGSATLLQDRGSTWQNIEAVILTAGRVCYRDPSGRRMFGMLTGSLSLLKPTWAVFQFKITEAS